MAKYEIEFYEDEHGDAPVLRWLREELTPTKRRALGMAMLRTLQELGVAVCGTEYGKHLGGGLFEFRLRGRDLARIAPPGSSGGTAEAKLLLRVFCHAYGDRIVLLLGGYDKGEHPSARRQASEIEVARSRFRDWQRRRRRRR
jgi:hypothetical protein